MFPIKASVPSNQYIELHIDTYLQVRLTKFGRKILLEKNHKVIEEDGWSTWRLTELMKLLGPFMVDMVAHYGLGVDRPFENVMRVKLEDARAVECAIQSI